MKEQFFVRVPSPDGQVPFFNASSYIGKQMPYAKPQATCAMRVEDDVVSFSLLHLTKKTAASIATSDIMIPRGPLSRLQRRAAALELADGEIAVEMDDAFYKLNYRIDENGLAIVDVAPGGGGGDDKDEDVTFDLPLRAVQLSVYLRSAKVGRTLAVGFIGHLGKPGTPETITRAAGMVLNSISGLVEFRLLSGIETVKIPAPPSKWAARPPARRPEDRVVLEVLLNMFTPELAPVGSGSVILEIDLENANPTTGRLLYHMTPSETVAEAFPEYRSIVDGAVTDMLRRELGDELTQITYEVVLGEVDAGTLERLRDALKGMAGLDVTPREYRVHEIVAVS